MKEAHEVQEHGETVEFEDEIDYIVDGLNDKQKVPTRCLRLVLWNHMSINILCLFFLSRLLICIAYTMNRPAVHSSFFLTLHKSH